MAEPFFGLKIKLAVDVTREILDGGELHFDCEQLLLDAGIQQENIWIADLYPQTKEVRVESIINIRPRQQNMTMEVRNLQLKVRIEKIVRYLLEVM
ncbi:DUF5674 family protein [Pseudanabaena sp. Chao 1811]|uniref:DUF5674 family protein n=1 Tax=Pseudanabaena sp. Chao 1811 TaxID=2963092 RepID=UPI0022F3D5B8|nr:DUF5674 family protein [Pseudanabaena sp. Chao 1811]